MIQDKIWGFVTGWINQTETKKIPYGFIRVKVMYLKSTFFKSSILGFSYFKKEIKDNSKVENFFFIKCGNKNPIY